jgi:hypothetical protein
MAWTSHCLMLRSPTQKGGPDGRQENRFGHAYWQPTAASYFGRVSKERIVGAGHTLILRAVEICFNPGQES